MGLRKGYCFNDGNIISQERVYKNEIFKGVTTMYLNNHMRDKWGSIDYVDNMVEYESVFLYDKYDTNNLLRYEKDPIYSSSIKYDKLWFDNDENIEFEM